MQGSDEYPLNNKRLQNSRSFVSFLVSWFSWINPFEYTKTTEIGQRNLQFLDAWVLVIKSFGIPGGTLSLFWPFMFVWFDGV